MNGRWFYASEFVINGDEIENLLSEGWEPFAVSEHRLHLRLWVAADTYESDQSPESRVT